MGSYYGLIIDLLKDLWAHSVLSFPLSCWLSFTCRWTPTEGKWELSLAQRCTGGQHTSLPRSCQDSHLLFFSYCGRCDVRILEMYRLCKHLLGHIKEERHSCSSSWCWPTRDEKEGQHWAGTTGCLFFDKVPDVWWPQHKIVHILFLNLLAFPLILCICQQIEREGTLSYAGPSFPSPTAVRTFRFLFLFLMKEKRKGSPAAGEGKWMAVSE